MQKKHEEPSEPKTNNSLPGENEELQTVMYRPDSMSEPEIIESEKKETVKQKLGIIFDRIIHGPNGKHRAK